MKRSSLVAVVVLAVVCGWLSSSSAALMDWIFADSFESGNAGAWSVAFGPYLVVPEAASEGSFGFRVPVTLDVPAWVQDGNANGEAIVRADFDLRTDNLSMNSGDAFDFFVGWVVDDATTAFSVSLLADAGQISLVINLHDSSGGFLSSPPVPLPGPGWHRIGVEYGAGTGPGGSGEMRLFVNGAPEASLGVFDNQILVVNSLRLGAVGGVDQGTSGSIDIDVFTAVRLFNPWPCSQSSGGEPTDGMSVCLDGEGRSTAIATGGCGDGVVVWRGSEDLDVNRSRLGGIYGRPVRGSARQANDTFLIVQDESAETPAVAMDADCRFAVAWHASVTGEAIFAGVYDTDGTPLSPVVQVAMQAEAEEWPVIAVSDQGRFLVVWRREFSAEQSIWGRYFEADATPLGAEFQIDEGSGDVSPPTVAMSGDGSAVVAWASAGVIQGHLFDDSGNSLDLVTLTGGPADDEPAVAMMSDGGFVLAWTRESAERPVFLRRFGPAGGPVSDEVRADTLTPADCSEPHLAVGPADGVTVVWSSMFGEFRSILGRAFTPDLEPLGPVFQIEGAGHVWFPSRPLVAAAERVLFSFSEQTEFLGFARGALVGARSDASLFADGFESGDPNAWSSTVF